MKISTIAGIICMVMVVSFVFWACNRPDQTKEKAPDAGSQPVAVRIGPKVSDQNNQIKEWYYSDRFEIKKVGEFDAAGRTREILEIYDKKTDHRYLGITGVGLQPQKTGYNEASRPKSLRTQS